MPSCSARQELRAPEPTHPSNSRAARSIHREPAQEPIITGGPPSAAGHTGSRDAPFTRSPFHSRRMTSSDSLRRLKRPAKSRPSASKSAAVEPAPTPRRSRPPEMRCVVSTRCASSTGLRSGTWSTPVPSSIVFVTVPATASAVSGSASRKPRLIESNAQALVKPVASIWRAASARLDGVSEPLDPPGRAMPKRVVAAVADMPGRVHYGAMNFGTFLLMQSPSARSSQEIFSRGVEVAQAAETLGFRNVWLAEHHFSTYGYLSRPVQLAHYIEDKAGRLRVGTAVIVVPLHHPLVIAEEIATLDLLAGGRVDIGLGRGYQHYEFERFGLELESSRARWEEAVDVILKAFS